MAGGIPAWANSRDIAELRGAVVQAIEELRRSSEELHRASGRVDRGLFWATVVLVLLTAAIVGLTVVLIVSE